MAMMTEVSRTPCSCRSDTRRRILVENRIEIAPQPGSINRCGPPEDRESLFGGDQLAAAEGNKASYRNPVAGDKEGLPPVEPAHDLAAMVAQLPLGDRMRHSGECSARATARLLR